MIKSTLYDKCGCFLEYVEDRELLTQSQLISVTLHMPEHLAATILKPSFNEKYRNEYKTFISIHMHEEYIHQQHTWQVNAPVSLPD